MAYTGYLQTTRGLTLTQRRDGAFFIRESSGYGYYGRAPSAWRAVKCLSIDDIGHVIADGIDFGAPELCEQLMFRISNQDAAFVFSLPEVEAVTGSPKIVRIEERYSDNNGAYQVAYWRDSTGAIHSIGNMYDHAVDFRQFTIADMLAYAK